MLPALFVCLMGFEAAAEQAGEEKQAETVELDGRQLYQRYCADCHHALADTNKPDRSGRRIHSAIKHLPVMNHLKHLNEAQSRAIAEVMRSEL